MENGLLTGQVSSSSPCWTAGEGGSKRHLRAPSVASYDRANRKIPMFGYNIHQLIHIVGISSEGLTYHLEGRGIAKNQ